MGRAEHIRGLVIAGLLGGAVLANVAHLPAVEFGPLRPIKPADTADVAQIGLDSSATVRRGRGLYLRLSQVAPGADVIMGPSSQLHPYQLYGLGAVQRVVRVDADLDALLAGLEVADHVIADDEDGWFGPHRFTIAVADNEVRTLVVRRVDGRHDLIDARLLPLELRDGIPG